MSLLPQPKMIIMSVRHLSGGHRKPSFMHTSYESLVRMKARKKDKEEISIVALNLLLITNP